MEKAISDAERRRVEIQSTLQDPAVYSISARVQELTRELERTTAEIDRLYARWQELEARG